MGRQLLASENEIRESFGTTPYFPTFHQKIPFSEITEPTGYLFSFCYGCTVNSGASYLYGVISRFRFGEELVKQYTANIFNIGGSYILSDSTKSLEKTAHHIKDLNHFPPSYFDQLPEEIRSSLLEKLN